MSYARQGVDIEPTIHLGRGAAALEERGIHTDRGDINRRIIKERDRENRELEKLRSKQLERSFERSR